MTDDNTESEISDQGSTVNAERVIKNKRKCGLGRQIRNALIPMTAVVMGVILVIICAVIKREGVKQAVQQVDLMGSNAYNSVFAPVFELESREDMIAAMYKHSFLKKNADVGELIRMKEAKSDISPTGFYYVTQRGKCYTVDDTKVIGTMKSEYLNETWYNNGLYHKTAAVESCAYSSKSGGYTLSVLRQMRASNGNVMGVIAADISLDYISSSLANISGSSPYELILIDTTNNLVAASSQKELTGYKSGSGKNAMLDEIFADIANGDVKRSYRYGFDRKYVNIIPVNDTSLYLVSYFDEAEVSKPMNIMMLVAIIAITLGLMLMGSAIIAVSNKKMKGIMDAKDAVVRMCSGDFTELIDNKGCRYDDEISQITDNLNYFIFIMQDMLKQLRDIAEQTDVQAGDFNKMAKGIDDNAIKQTTDIQDLNNSLSQMAGATQHLALDASELVEIARETQDRSGQAGKDMQDAIDAMERAKDAEKTIFHFADLAQKAKDNLSRLPGTDEIVASIDRSVENVIILQKSFDEMETSFKNAGRSFGVVGKQTEKLYSVASSIAAISEEQAASSEEISEAAENAAAVVAGTEDETAILNDGAQMLRHNASEMKSKMNQFTLPGDKDNGDE